MFVLLVIASAFGAVTRFAVERFSAKLTGEAFPYGTLFANLAGSFILGWALTAISNEKNAENVVGVPPFHGRPP